MLNHNDDQNEAKKMVLFCVAAASMVLLLFLVVLYMHDSKNTSKHVVKQNTKEAANEPDIEVGKSNIVSSDLDFWDMYDNDIKKPIEDEEDLDEDLINKKKEEAKNFAKQKASSSSSKDEDDFSDLSMNNRNKKDKDEMDDGKHIKVIGSDGKAQWFEILEDMKKNKYDFENYLTYDNGILKYSSSDTKTLAGIDISNYQGNIDFAKVKAAGIDFVMIKVASRGYESGQINIDNKFVEYATGALGAGLPIGAFITSSAITDVEAVEEANYAVAAANNYNVKYPIAIDFTKVTNDSSRTDKLTNSERTAIVKKFCETVESYGKHAAICASRDFLIANLDLLSLAEYDIWLKDEAVTADYMRTQYIDNDDDDENENSSSSSSTNKNRKQTTSSSSTSSSSEIEELPDYIGTDYPYVFSLWQYTNKGTINGIDGNVNIDLSFVNYAER